MSGGARPSHRRGFVMFFLGSLGGLTVDLGGFWLLATVGVPPGIANVTSSAASVTVVYLLVTRFTFGTGVRLSTYVLFVAWYGCNIAVTSTAIQVASTLVLPLPLLWKIASIPLSFLANYGFSRWLFSRDGNRRSATVEAASTPIV